MEVAATTKASQPVENFASAPLRIPVAETAIPVSVHSARVDGRTEGVAVSEVAGTYTAKVEGPPEVSTSSGSLAGAEDKLAFIVNLFA